jgi:hypothetical protein
MGKLTVTQVAAPDRSSLARLHPILSARVLRFSSFWTSVCSISLLASLRGSGHHPSSPVHWLAAMNHTTGAVLAQADVQATTNEIARFRPLLDHLDLVDTVVTADALHTQREHADWLVTQQHAQHAAYLLIVKANQPTLRHQLTALPWPDIPVTDHTRDPGHGRVETRHLQVTTIAGLDFPTPPRRSASPGGPGPCAAGGGTP